MLVQKSAIAWSADVGREVTIQIRPVEGEVMESNLRTAVALAEATPGVASAHALTLEESQKLLEPWLGAGLDLTAIEIPRLVVVQLADPVDADIEKLGRDLAAVKGASLDTHAAWRQQLNTMAGTVVVSGLLVLALIGVATVLAIIFATRGAMASNREIVDVLHYIGASNKFIAGEFQGRFLSIGLRGGFLGARRGHAVLLPDRHGRRQCAVGRSQRPGRRAVRPLCARHRWHYRHRRGGPGDRGADRHHLAHDGAALTWPRCPDK